MPYARIALFWLAVIALPAAAAAELQGASANGAPDRFGDETRGWLELQRSGQTAAPGRSMSGVAASRIYKRYLDSFEHPLPMFFERESATVSAQ